MSTFGTHDNESGFILVTSLLVLVVLSLVGISATRNSVVELQIAGNDRTVKVMFYDAEAAAMETGGRLENESDREELVASRSSKRWLNKEVRGIDPVAPDENDPTKLAKWTDANSKDVLMAGIDDDPNDQSIIKLAAVDRGVSRGASAGSLRMTGTTTRDYHLFGYAAEGSNWKVIEMGYRRNI